jgi:integrase
LVARTIGRLSDRKVRTAKPIGKTPDGKPRTAAMLCDGGGLYLQATLGLEVNVRRSWIFRFKRPGYPTRDMGLGSLNDVSLAHARELARECRLLVKEGIDPKEHRDARVAKNLAASAAVMTFDQAAEAYIRQHAVAWKNPKHARQWPTSLRTYASPVIGRMSVGDIDTPHVLRVLEPIWLTTTETASRVRGRIEAVLGWAKVSGYRTGDNPARWRDHLENLLPACSKVQATKPQTALPYRQMPAFVAQLRERKAMAALALEFTALTCVRASDVCNAKWADIDRADGTWTIPRLSKTAREHRVPLADAALAVLDKAQQIARGIGGAVGRSDYVFPNDVTGAALSTGSMWALLSRMGMKSQTSVHGLRAAFRTWAQEQTNFPWELAEMTLGHTVGSRVERAYARGSALQKRVAIMQAWARFLAEPPQPGKVIPLQKQRDA